MVALALRPIDLGEVRVAQGALALDKGTDLQQAELPIFETELDIRGHHLSVFATERVQVANLLRQGDELRGFGGLQDLVGAAGRDVSDSALRVEHCLLRSRCLGEKLDVRRVGVDPQ